MPEQTFLRGEPEDGLEIGWIVKRATHYAHRAFEIDFKAAIYR